MPGTTTGEVLAAARRGDGSAFETLLAPHLSVLHLHCYRLLGSFHDAEEAMQEVLLRAWRSLDTFEERAPLRHWLYRIATTTCLKLMARRTRQPVAVEEIEYLSPYPDRLLDELPAGSDPAAEVERRETVSLAFIAALQMLPPTQRAALILHDVLAWRSEEIAQLLDTSVAAVNSALQRARATTRGSAPLPGPARPRLNAEDRDLLARFMDAWHRRDIDGLAALLRDDVAMRMPPESVLLAGRDAVIGFFATVPADGRLETIRLVATRANGQPAVAAFETGPDGGWLPYGIMVFDLDGGTVSTITGFPTAREPGLDTAFGVRPE